MRSDAEVLAEVADPSGHPHGAGVADPHEGAGLEEAGCDRGTELAAEVEPALGGVQARVPVGGVGVWSKKSQSLRLGVRGATPSPGWISVS